MVTVVLEVTAWAAKTPSTVIVPELDPHETAVFGLFGPVTVAVHWLVWPD